MEDSLLSLPDSNGIVSHAADIFEEYNCLNLNITVAAGAQAGDNLLVMVYVQGGILGLELGLIV
jgi:carboxylesterase type B